MDFRERELIEKTLELAEENNKMLRRLYRNMKWSRAWRIFYWVIIIGLSVGAYYYIQPYVKGLLDVYGGIEGDLKNIQNMFSAFRGS